MIRLRVPRLAPLAFAALMAACGTAANTEPATSTSSGNPVASEPRPSPASTNSAVAATSASATPSVSTARSGSVTEQLKAVYVGCGYLLAESYGNVHFQASIFGSSVRNLPQPGHFWWLVDDVLVETIVASADMVGDPSARGTNLLKKYMTWETEYLAKENDCPPPTADVARPFESAGFEGLSWGFGFPHAVPWMNQIVVAIAYAGVTIDDMVFVLAAPIRGDHDLEPANQAMGRILRTIRRTDVPLDVDALSQQIKRNPGKRWDGCPP